jgi:hypothetical protein
MKEFSTLFVAEYLVSSLFLIPLVGLYLCLNFRKVALVTIINLHKVILLLSIALPIAMGLISISESLDSEFLKWDESSQPQLQIRGDTETVASYTAIARDFPIGDHAVNRLPSIQDVIFYFMDLIGLFSLLDFIIFSIRWALQTVHLSRIKKRQCGFNN